MLILKIGEFLLGTDNMLITDRIKKAHIITQYNNFIRYANNLKLCFNTLNKKLIIQIFY